MRYSGVLCSSLLILFACGPAAAQAVVSTHSGLINFTEGSVLLDDQPLNQKFGTFSSVKDGSVLRTEKGRAEILLTPGVILRIDENSAIRMVSSDIANTRVEFLRGAAILDSNDATADPVVLVYKTYQLRFPKPGVYRIDAEPSVFATYTGEAEIVTAGEPPRKIDESHQFFFNIGMETKKYGDGRVDTFSEWARSRAETLAADNRAANQSTADPADPGDTGTAPFGIPAPTPSYGIPSYPSIGSIGGGISLGGLYDPYGVGFNNPYGPLLGAPIVQPIYVFYMFPRFYGRHPVNPPPHKTGYPVLPPARAAFPRPNPTVPARSSNLPLAMRSPGSVRDPASLRNPALLRTPGLVRSPALVGSPAPMRNPAIGRFSVAAPRPVSPAMVRPMGPSVAPVRHR